MNFKHLIYLAIFFSCWFLSTGYTYAANPAVTLILSDKKIELSKDELLQLSGAGRLENSSNALEAKISSKEIFMSFYNQKNQSSASVTFYQHRPEKIYSLISKIAKENDRPAAEPVLKIENNLVKEFTPPITGEKTLVYESTLAMLNALENKTTQIQLITSVDKPSKNLSETNNLGINELIAKGKSNFSGSPKNRRHNINVGVEKFKGLIIQKGEEFSFNKYLGPVEAENGFLPELVIKRTGTVPELGGGLCQVSSTTFRAAMEAGLPITQRRNHAYAVQYYSPQGTDATIYPGVVDLKFLNDTPGAILVWPYFTDKDNLVFEFYGTKDSRQVALEKPVQYDRKPDGSLKAYWNRTVIKDGVENKDSFKSTYQPPALFHKTEEFVTATPNSTTGLQMPKQN